MTKTDKTNKNMNQKKIADQSSSSSRSYRFSPEAKAILDKIGGRGSRGVSDFVSQCVVEYGPVLIKKRKTQKDSDGFGNLAERLDFIEKYLLGDIYDWAIGELAKPGKKSLLVYKEIIKDFESELWTDPVTINKIKKQATEKGIKKKTSAFLWKILLRNRKKFLEDYEE